MSTTTPGTASRPSRKAAETSRFKTRALAKHARGELEDSDEEDSPPSSSAQVASSSNKRLKPDTQAVSDTDGEDGSQDATTPAHPRASASSVTTGHKANPHIVLDTDDEDNDGDNDSSPTQPRPSAASTSRRVNATIVPDTDDEDGDSSPAQARASTSSTATKRSAYRPVVPDTEDEDEDPSPPRARATASSAASKRSVYTSIVPDTDDEDEDSSSAQPQASTSSSVNNRSAYTQLIPDTDEEDELVSDQDDEYDEDGNSKPSFILQQASSSSSANRRAYADSDYDEDEWICDDDDDDEDEDLGAAGSPKSAKSKSKPRGRPKKSKSTTSKPASKSSKTTSTPKLKGKPATTSARLDIEADEGSEGADSDGDGVDELRLKTAAASRDPADDLALGDLADLTSANTGEDADELGGEEEDELGHEDQDELAATSASEHQAIVLFHCVSRIDQESTLERALSYNATTLPDDHVLREVFTPRLQHKGAVDGSDFIDDDSDDGEGEVEDDGETKDVNGIMWRRVWMFPRVGSYWLSPTNERDYITFPVLPASTSSKLVHSGESWDKTGIRLCIDFAYGRADLGCSIPVWLEPQDVKKRVPIWLDPNSGKVYVYPFFKDFIATGGDYDAAFIRAHDEESLEAQYARVAHDPAAIEELLRDNEDVVYVEFGMNGEIVAFHYGGKSRRVFWRRIQHSASTLAWSLAGRDKGPLHQAKMAQCEETRTFAVAKILKSAGNAEERAEGLGVWEWYVCLTLACYRLNEQYLKTRADYGMPIPSSMGVNGTMCLDGPDLRFLTKKSQPSYGAASEEYIAARRLHVAALLNMIKAQYRAVVTAASVTSMSHDDPSITEAKQVAERAAAEAEKAVQVRVKARQAAIDICDELSLAGKLLWDLPLEPLNARDLVSVLGRPLSTRELAGGRDLFRGSTAKVGRVAVRLTITDERSAEEDFAFSCYEHEIPLFKGIRWALDRADKEKKTFPVPLQSELLPRGQSSDRLLWRGFNAIKDEGKKVSRRTASDDKLQEIDEREELPVTQQGAARPFSSLSELARRGQKGTIPLKGHYMIKLGNGANGKPVVFSMGDQAKHGRAAKMRTTLGLKPNVPKYTRKLSTFVRFVKGDPKFSYFDFDNPKLSRALRHQIEKHLHILVLDVYGSWVRFPYRFAPTPPSYGAKDQIENSKRSVAFLAILNAWRDINSLDPRDAVELPPGVSEPRGGYTATAITKKGKIRPSKKINFLGGVGISLNTEVQTKIWGKRKPKKPLYRLMTSYASQDCEDEEDFELYLQGLDHDDDGAVSYEGPWITYPWPVGNQHGTMRARLWKEYQAWEVDFKKAEHPFPTDVDLSFLNS